MFTDRFGSPLNLGDRIVVAVPSGNSSATLQETVVVGLIPLVPHRDNTEPRKEKVYDHTTKRYVETSKIAGYHYMRADQDAQMGPTDFYRPANTPLDKLFVLQYQQYARYDWSGKKKGEPTRKQAFDRVMDVVKVPDGV